MCVCSAAQSSLSTTPCTVTHQAPLSMGFFQQEYWNELPFPSPGDLLEPGIKSGSPALQADSLLTELQEKSQQNFLNDVISGAPR